MNTVRQFLESGAASYERRAEHERSRAEQATNGSKIQAELMMASKFNEGRAAAFREVLELIG